MSYVIPQWRLGDRLRRAREEAGLEQAELAERLGISKAAVSAYEKGRRTPRDFIRFVKRWADETEVPWQWLADDDFVSSLWITDSPGLPVLARTA